MARSDAKPRLPTNNTPESVDEDWYVFVLDENQVTIAHPNPEHLGRTREQRIDTKGYDYGAEFLTATEEGKWIDYVFLNPGDRKRDVETYVACPSRWTVLRLGLVWRGRGIALNTAWRHAVLMWKLTKEAGSYSCRPPWLFGLAPAEACGTSHTTVQSLSMPPVAECVYRVCVHR